MGAEIENSDDHKLSLVPVLDLCAAKPLLAQLTEHRGQDLILDASDVERVGTQCVQVLWSAVQTWNADQKSLNIVNPSPIFSETLCELGVHLQSNLEKELETCL